MAHGYQSDDDIRICQTGFDLYTGAKNFRRKIRLPHKERRLTWQRLSSYLVLIIGLGILLFGLSIGLSPTLVCAAIHQAKSLCVVNNSNNNNNNNTQGTRILLAIVPIVFLVYGLLVALVMYSIFRRRGQDVEKSAIREAAAGSTEALIVGGRAANRIQQPERKRPTSHAHPPVTKMTKMTKMTTTTTTTTKPVVKGNKSNGLVGIKPSSSSSTPHTNGGYRAIRSMQPVHHVKKQSNPTRQPRKTGTAKKRLNAAHAYMISGRVYDDIIQEQEEEELQRMVHTRMYQS